jgi:hypothetical protein
MMLIALVLTAFGVVNDVLAWARDPTTPALKVRRATEPVTRS